MMKKTAVIPSLSGFFILYLLQLSFAQTSVDENIILGRPTDDAIGIHVRAPEGTDVFAEYGQSSGVYSDRTATAETAADDLREVSVDGLDPDTRYYYRVNYRRPGAAEFEAGAEHTFHTQRPRGSTFSFGVQGDSHPERPGPGRMFHTDLYTRTMENVAAAQPDLYFTLGDDFSISNQMYDLFQGDKTAMTQATVDAVYQNQRNYFGVMAHSTALMLVNGNHEEARRHLLNTPLHDVSIFAGNARTRIYPLPSPDDFYSVDEDEVSGVGLLKDYFAFQWGDALFVAIDPYWQSPAQVGMTSGMGMGSLAEPPWDEIQDEWTALTAGPDDPWDSTIGDDQYQWLKTTLEDSEARWKFIFAHHVLGTGRGAVEMAGLYEWGGHSADGTWEFDERRPNWELPIHQLMVENDVTIFFQGHDHLYARQELDGLIYQEVPNPGDPTPGEVFCASCFHEAYLTGELFPNSGYLNVTVSPDDVRVDYVKSYLPEGTLLWDDVRSELDGHENREIGHSYTIR
jgi:hypothetical protein